MHLTVTGNVDQILDGNGEAGATVRHVYSYNSLCRICDLKWDFIGKLDTYSYDIDYIYSKMNIDMKRPIKREKQTDHSKE